MPELARSSKTPTPDRARGSRMTTTDVAAGSSRFEARSKTIGDAQPRTDPTISARSQRPRASIDGRTRDTGSSCRPVSGGARDVVQENPMIDRNARLVPIDY
jgi:hypothetical protein